VSKLPELSKIIYDTTVVQLNSSKVRCRIGEFAEPKIEPEIVVHFGTAPPVSTNIAGVLASIDWIAHGIEIVQSKAYHQFYRA
jgi:2-oxo-3-hexenedioate decarboxylase